MCKVTKTTSDFLSTAFDHFNKELFQGRLPECFISLHRKSRAYGYFWQEAFAERKQDGNNGKAVHEIALNPETFKGRTDKEILSTLVHEMTHLEQAEFGQPSANGYHNKAWALLMLAVGLHPSDTGQPGGKQTGAQCSHYIIDGGKFDKSCDKLLARKNAGFNVQAATQSGEQKARAAAKKKSKTKYTCDTCHTNAWAKPETQLICGGCYESAGDVVFMEEEA